MARTRPPAPPLPAWEAPPVWTAAKAEFAAELEVTPAALSQWIARGLPVRPDTRIDMAEACRWLIQNLDAVAAHRTRSNATDLHRWLFGLADTRLLVRETIEQAASVAHDAARAAGLDDDAAGRLADTISAGTVERMNGVLSDDGNLPLPAPPPELWKRRQGAATAADILAVGGVVETLVDTGQEPRDGPRRDFSACG